MDDQEFGEMRSDVKALLRNFEHHDSEEIRWRENLDQRLNKYAERLSILERWKEGVGGAILGGKTVLLVVWSLAVATLTIIGSWWTLFNK